MPKLNIWRVVFISTLIIFSMKLGYSQKQTNWNDPLCIASDTGMGGPRYIETTFPLTDFFGSPQKYHFNLRCRADVPIKIEPDNSGTTEAEAFVASLQQYKPIQEAFFTYTNVVTNYGESTNIFDVFKLNAHRPGKTIYLPVLGPGKYHEFPVNIELSVKIFQPGYQPENPKPISPLYLPILNVTQIGGQPSYAPYEIIVAMGIDAYPDPCITPTVNIGHPGDIDFGAMSKEDLNQTITKNLSLRISRSAKDSCSYPLYPIITFSATDPVVNDNIELKNGTLLSLDGVKHSSRGNENFGKLKFNTPIRLGEIGLDENIILAMEAHLRKNPKKEVKGGAFSTTVIYHIEYR